MRVRQKLRAWPRARSIWTRRGASSSRTAQTRKSLAGRKTGVLAALRKENCSRRVGSAEQKTARRYGHDWHGTTERFDDERALGLGNSPRNFWASTKRV